MTPTRAILILLIAVHGLLVAWAVVGLIEWFWTEPPWPRVSNPLFPRAVLLMQWTLTLTAGIVFILGNARNWLQLPVAMAVIYAAMAAVCAVETFQYMESGTRFLAMGAEYAAYVAILVFLFRTRALQGV